MKISVITVCYNAVDSIQGTLESIKNQTYKNIETIIIDGGSTDGTQQIIKKYSPNYYVSEADSGIYNAMNKGIKAATGDILFFLNADDSLYSNDVLKNVAKEFENSKAKIVFGNVYFTNKKNIPEEKLIIKNQAIYRYSHIKTGSSLLKENICHQCIFYRNDVFNSNRKFNENLDIIADYELNTRLLIKERLPVKYVDITVSYFDLGGASTLITDENSAKLKNEYEHILNSNIPFYKLKKLLKRLLLNHFMSLYKLIKEIKIDKKLNLVK